MKDNNLRVGDIVIINTWDGKNIGYIYSKVKDNKYRIIRSYNDLDFCYRKGINVESTGFNLYDHDHHPGTTLYDTQNDLYFYETLSCRNSLCDKLLSQFKMKRTYANYKILFQHQISLILQKLIESQKTQFAHLESTFKRNIIPVSSITKVTKCLEM